MNEIISYLKCLKFVIFRKIPFTIKILFSKHTNLNHIKGKYKGKRCFIVATGPSLQIEDLEKLKNEYTISMNSIVKLFNKTTWRPNFYLLQDKLVLEALGPLENYFYNCQTVPIVSEFVSKNTPGLINKYVYRLSPYSDVYTMHTRKISFTNDASKFICDGRTVTYSAIQLATYLGFNEIYLLGVDWDYSKNKDNHFDGLSLPYENLPETNDMIDIQLLIMHLAYEWAKKYSEERKIKIIDVGRGGKLDVFEKQNFDELFLYK